MTGKPADATASNSVWFWWKKNMLSHTDRDMQSQYIQPERAAHYHYICIVETPPPKTEQTELWYSLFLSGHKTFSSWISLWFHLICYGTWSILDLYRQQSCSW